MMSDFPKSVTQARLAQHEDEFERLASELSRSKKSGAAAVLAVNERVGELALNLDELEARERDTRNQGDKNKE